MRSRYAFSTDPVIFLVLTVSFVGCSASVPVPPAKAMLEPLPRAAAIAAADSPFPDDSETYAHVVESGILAAVDHPLSTFSIDTDTASYSNIRRFLQQGQLPPADAVRIEECLNYFAYDYPPPDGDAPFSIHAEVAGCPWNPAHRLAKLGIQGRQVSQQQRPSANLVFLLDVSGSMNHPKKLPLLKESMRLLVEQLNENDHIAIVVYAGAAGLVLPSTPASQSKKIGDAIDALHADGSTNGAIGITLAYQIAAENRIPNGINRVILCTDGDFNVGITNRDELTTLIQAKARSGVFLSVLGFGMGNIKDDIMEGLADRGNGNYAYIDSFTEAKKCLVDQLSGTLVTIAKDVKIQVHFNPAQVSGYRLIGYDNRRLANQDFTDDAKDAGEIGAGHSVTALYEIIPANDASTDTPTAENKPSDRRNISDELFTVKLRYKLPDDEQSRETQFAVADRGTPFVQASSDFRFAAAVTEFAMLLKNSAHRGQATYDSILELTDSARTDPKGYRTEFFDLVRQARGLRHNSTAKINTPAD